MTGNMFRRTIVAGVSGRGRPSWSAVPDGCHREGNKREYMKIRHMKESERNHGTS